jgi:diguanylate cyclase (GGDEF)-like protein
MDTNTALEPVRILIVEDELLIAQSLARKLGKLGHKVVGMASSGLDAIEAAEKERPDIVLMDIILQGEMDGIAAAEHIYEELHIPVVFVTAFADEDTLLEAQRVGAYGYILKPYQDTAVNAALRIALTKHRELVNLRHEASVDPLTGALNRRQFLLLARKEYHRWRRYGVAFCLMLIDVDHFKTINDTWGHGTGDSALKTVVERIQATVRLSDSLGRVGGDEFAVILPHTALKDARMLAERLRASVEGASVAGIDTASPLSLSIGVSAIQPEDASLEHMFERVDKNLYRAKRQGRNQVEAL